MQRLSSTNSWDSASSWSKGPGITYRIFTRERAFQVNGPHKKADYKRAWGSIAKQFVRNPSLVCRDYRAQTVGTAPPHGRSKGPGITYRIFTRERAFQVKRPHKKADYKRAWGSIAKQFVRNPSLVCRDYRAQTVGTAPS